MYLSSPDTLFVPLQEYFGVLDMVQCGCVDGANEACSAGLGGSLQCVIGTNLAAGMT